MAARSDHCPARHHFALAPSRAIWGSGSCRRWRGGRPRISGEVRALIVRMSQENFLWGAPRIRGELLKLGFVVSQTTVSRYMPRRGYPLTQRWRTFLRNQAFAIGAIGFGQVSYQTSSADGSCELAGAPPKCGMASLAGLSRHRRPCARCGHVALPIVQIGASPKGVACPAPRRPIPQSGTHWTWPVDDFHRIVQGHHRDASCPAFGTRSSAIARRAKRTTIPLRRTLCVCHEQSETPQKACSKK